MERIKRKILIKNILYYVKCFGGLCLLYFVCKVWGTYDYVWVPLDNFQMTPRFKPKEFYWGKRISDVSTLKHNNVIYYNYPHRLTGSRNECLFFARVLGLPGDRLAIKDGKVYRNGNIVEEVYLDPTSIKKETLPELLIPRDYVYVLNDNRMKMGPEIYFRDSRSWGPLLGNCLIGVFMDDK
jgi:signal peptidase I